MNNYFVQIENIGFIDLSFAVILVCLILSLVVMQSRVIVIRESMIYKIHKEQENIQKEMNKISAGLDRLLEKLNK